METMTDNSEPKPLSDPELRKRLRTLLANLHDWQSVNNRISLVKDALGEHPAQRNLDLDGKPISAASNLIHNVLMHLNTPMENGHSPICGLLSVIEERGLASADSQSELDALAEFFACRKSLREPRLWEPRLAAKSPTESAQFINPFAGLRTLRNDEANIFFGRAGSHHHLWR